LEAGELAVRMIKGSVVTAALLVIGGKILSGRIKDQNIGSA
jgi:hypothetical protein